MNIALCSAFRDAASYLPRYLRQVDALALALHKRGVQFAMVGGEGDSEDHTLTMLRAACYRFPALLVDCTHGGGHY